MPIKMKVPKNLKAFRATCLNRFYDDGDLRIRCRYHYKVKVGQLAGYLGKSGYRRVVINYEWYLVHRILWLLRTGEWPKEELDHINGDRSDNRPENLRPASNTQNTRNRKPLNGCLYKGIYPKWSKWSATIIARGVKYYLGTYDTPGEAALAYDKKARELHKDFAWLNFPGLE